MTPHFFGKNTQIVVVFGSLWLQEVAYYVQSDEFELVGFLKTDGLPLTNMHFVSNYSEGVSCQSQRRFPEKMGESSTGESVDVVEKEKQFSFTLLS